MTTIQVKKNMDLGAGATDYVITLQNTIIEETITKELISFPLPKDSWGKPTATSPYRMAIDLVSLNRVFTVTGWIDVESSDEVCVNSVNRTPRSASEVRDIIVNMIRYGGALYFHYGVQADVDGSTRDGYIPEDYNIYFNTTGFPCHVNRLQLKEGAHASPGKYRVGSVVKEDYKDGSGDPTYGTWNLPSRYSITLEMVHAIDEEV